MTTPVFLLGLGAQKCGTTWLHRYLRGSSGFAAGPMKEYHVWNGVYPGPEPLPPFDGAAAAEKEALRRQFIAEPERYFDHFAALLAQPDMRVAADITPAYAALSAEALNRIQSGFATRGIAVKVVFLMRDPVERAWSALRMYRQRGLLPQGLDRDADDDALLPAFAASGVALRRGRYEKTIAAVEETFPREDTYIGLYEMLFSPGGVEAISRFLNIPARPEAREERHNVTQRKATLSHRARREVACTYRDTLDFCAERFPQTRTVWSSYDALA